MIHSGNRNRRHAGLLANQEGYRIMIGSRPESPHESEFNAAGISSIEDVFNATLIRHRSRRE
jgi:hypothetical protein